MAVSEKGRLVLTLAGIVTVGVATGLFLGGGLLPTLASQQQYNVQTSEAARELNVVHADNTTSQHVHRVTTTVVVTETTPHGYTHDFAANLTQGLFANNTSTGVTQASNEVWVWAREYHPSTLTVSVGTKVTWINKDLEEHSVNSNTGIFGGPLPGLNTFSYTFNEPGTYPYYCEPHPGMAGVVIVK